MEYDFDNICRICMEESENYVKLSAVDDDFVEFSTKLYFCIPSIQIDDANFPQQLCHACTAQLKSTYVFKNKCLTATQKIHNLLYSKDIHLIKVKKEFTLQSADTPVIEDDFFHENDSEASGNNIKKVQTVKETESADEENDVMDIKLESVENNSPDTFLEETLLEPIYENLNQDENSDSNDTTIDLEDYTEMQAPTLSASDKHKKRAKSLKRDNPTNYQYYCTICSLGFEYDLFLEHSAIHNDLDVISCPTCKREFDSSNITLFFRHYCPNHNRPFLFSCTICYRNFKTRQALTYHSTRIHREKDPDKEYYCQICDTYFNSQQKLDWHMRNGIHTDKITKKLKKY